MYRVDTKDGTVTLTTNELVRLLIQKSAREDEAQELVQELGTSFEVSGQLKNLTPSELLYIGVQIGYAFKNFHSNNKVTYVSDRAGVNSDPDVEPSTV